MPKKKKGFQQQNPGQMQQSTNQQGMEEYGAEIARPTPQQEAQQKAEKHGLGLGKNKQNQ